MRQCATIRILKQFAAVPWPIADRQLEYKHNKSANARFRLRHVAALLPHAADADGNVDLELAWPHVPHKK